MRQLKFWYAIQNYESHRRVAEVYKKMLGLRYKSAKSIADADFVVLHIEPHDYASLYERLPLLRGKYVISYCVWEASELPMTFQRSLELVQEVWTCSRYCANIIRTHHARVFCVPHVVERNSDSHPVDEAIVRRLICFDPRNYHFLSIGRTLTPRKNLAALVRLFETTFSSMPNARLIIKGLPGEPMICSADARIVYLPMLFSESQINALYKATDVYVSPHHSEGWGLTLSDAMVFEKPVVATGYSGNLEFMNDSNSFLIPFVENYIREDELWGPFTPQMKWADPDVEYLREILKSLYDGSLRKEAVYKTKLAQEDMQHFSFDHVCELLFERMDGVESRT